MLSKYFFELESMVFSLEELCYFKLSYREISLHFKNNNVEIIDFDDSEESIETFEELKEAFYDYLFFKENKENKENKNAKKRRVKSFNN